MELRQLINRLKVLADYFLSNGIDDIYTNSKIYEVLIAEQFGHQIINGHANTPDARDGNGEFYEYKHYKVSSSNHTWTFNDFTDRTIEKLYYVDEDKLEKVLENPQVIKTPVVRNGKQSTLGYQPDVWKEWK